jgi:hypothetical protein
VFIEGKRKVIQEPDHERAPFYIEMFKLRASGAYTDLQIVELVNAMGFVTKKFKRWSLDKSRVIGYGGGVPLSVKQLQVIIQNPIYCGVNTEKWLQVPIKTKYEGLVSIDTFNRANRGKLVIEPYANGRMQVHRHNGNLKIKRLRNNPDYPFRFLRCDICRRALCGSASTGKSGKRFAAYHCTSKHRSVRIKQQDVHNTMAGFVQKLRFKDGFTDCLGLSLVGKYHERQQELAGFEVTAKQNLAELETIKKQKVEAYAFTQSTTVRAELEKDIEALQERIEQKNIQKDKMAIKDTDIETFAGFAKKLMEHPEKVLLNKDNINQLRAFYTLIFDEMPSYTEIVNGTLKLSLVFRLSKEFGAGKSRLVNLEDFSWNTLEDMIKKWNDLLGGYFS